MLVTGAPVADPLWPLGELVAGAGLNRDGLTGGVKAAGAVTDGVFSDGTPIAGVETDGVLTEGSVTRGGVTAGSAPDRWSGAGGASWGNGTDR